MKRCLVVSGIIFLFTIGMFAYASAMDLTADMITKEGKITSKGKIYVNGNKIRAEKGNTPIYNIVRGDKGIFWQINAAENTYVQGKVTPSSTCGQPKKYRARSAGRSWGPRRSMAMR